MAIFWGMLFRTWCFSKKLCVWSMTNISISKLIPPTMSSNNTILELDGYITATKILYDSCKQPAIHFGLSSDIRWFCFFEVLLPSFTGGVQLRVGLGFVGIVSDWPDLEGGR